MYECDMDCRYQSAHQCATVFSIHALLCVIQLFFVTNRNNIILVALRSRCDVNSYANIMRSLLAAVDEIRAETSFQVH